MTPMKARMIRSSRLDSGRTTAATAPARAAAASAMDGAPRVDPDPLTWHDDRHGAFLGDPQAAHEIHREVGAEQSAPERVPDEIRTEKRPEERDGVHAHRQRVRRL